MNTIDPSSISVTDTRWIAANAWKLCETALPHMGSGGTYEIWTGICGNVIVGDDGQHWIGDLCYMREKFGWSHDEYMQAYGYSDYPAGAWRDQVNLTDHLQVHTFRDKHILVIRTGSDGEGPLGLGLDTAAVSFVTTDRARVEAAAAACIAWLEAKRADFAAFLEEEKANREAWEIKRAAKEAAEKLLTTAGNTIIGTRKVADYAGGGYRGRPRFKSRTEDVSFVLRSATAEFFTSTTGQRFKRSTFIECKALTPRQVGARKAAITRRRKLQTA